MYRAKDIYSCKVTVVTQHIITRGDAGGYIKAVGVSAAENREDGDEARAIREFHLEKKLLCSALETRTRRSSETRLILQAM